MEPKSYQRKVIHDLSTFLNYLQKYKKTDIAFNQYWEDRLVPYNPLSGEGMVPYKNIIPNTPAVCIKVPTAGGKTFIACNALSSIFNAYPSEMYRAVVWLVPWSNLLDQTVAALSDPEHPYRQRLNSLFNNRVEIYDKKSLLQGSNFNPSVVKEQLSIIVMSFASLRAKNKEERKVYQENGYLASFANTYSPATNLISDLDETSLINVIRSLEPVVVVDESHNAESALSVEMLQALNPSFVLDLTATPKNNSNIISMVPAIDLKKENMVKLPVIVYNHPDRIDVVNSALHLQRKLELLATEQQKNGGRYIRPIVLFQAQPKTGQENITYVKLKQQLLSFNIPESYVKIKTATLDELKGIDLLSPDCKVRYIITINALKEGWDCPFAYILASLADKSSAVDVEQIVGRVLRQPYVMKHATPLLNISYVLTASTRFNETLQTIVKGLQAAGFSSDDYRKINTMPPQDELMQADTLAGQPPFKTENDDETETALDKTRLTFDINNDSAQDPDSIHQIEAVAHEQIAALQTSIEHHKQIAADEYVLEETGNKVTRYKLTESGKKYINGIKLPQFYLLVQQSLLFKTGKELLSQEPLLKNFKLSNEDIKIDFDQTASDLYQIDIEETSKSQYDVRFTKVDNTILKEPVVAYILSGPKGNQVKDIAHQFVQIVGDMYPIAEKEIRTYIVRILESLNAEQLQDILLRKPGYSDKIKAKIKQHVDNYAEGRFNDLIKIGKIRVDATWQFPASIIPGATGASISKSLYEREGLMNNFETNVITDLASLPNIAFWHRNLGRGKGFCINGYRSNHYPDFIMGTKSGKIILVETKGDDRDNSDSRAKCRLGNKWAELAGTEFSYFMIFDKRPVEGAYAADKAKELIKEL